MYYSFEICWTVLITFAMSVFNHSCQCGKVTMITKNQQKTEKCMKPMKPTLFAQSTINKREHTKRSKRSLSI